MSVGEFLSKLYSCRDSQNYKEDAQSLLNHSLRFFRDELCMKLMGKSRYVEKILTAHPNSRKFYSKLWKMLAENEVVRGAVITFLKRVSKSRMAVSDFGLESYEADMLLKIIEYCSFMGIIDDIFDFSKGTSYVLLNLDSKRDTLPANEITGF